VGWEKMIMGLKEPLRKISDPEDRFNIEFWQAQGPEVIFQAAHELVRYDNYLKTGNPDLPQMDRTFGSFQEL